MPKLGHRAGQLTLCSCRGLYFVAGLQLPLCVCSVQTYRPARCERRHSVQAPCLPSAHFLQSDGLIASIHLPQLSRLGNQGWMKREGRECRTVLWNRVWRVGQQHISTPTPLICHMCSHNQSPPHSRAHAGSQACTQQGAHTHTFALMHVCANGLVHASVHIGRHTVLRKTKKSRKERREGLQQVGSTCGVCKHGVDDIFWSSGGGLHCTPQSPSSLSSLSTAHCSPQLIDITAPQHHNPH